MSRASFSTFRCSASRVLYCISLFVLCLSLFPADSFAVGPETVITSDTLEYFNKTKTYVAKGSVEIIKEDAVVNADEMTYHEPTSDVVAEGRVRYRDSDISLTAQKAELNMEAKTGRLFEAEIFYKKDNYYLSGKMIEKRGKVSYYSPSASVTTCDAPVPAWCFKGGDVDAVIGERVTARNATFRIKNIPVLYTPYLWAPVLTERQTGLLMPSISQSESRGFGLKVPFFWAVSENTDATFVLDSYSKRGTGGGLEYRYVYPGGISGNWWAYHIRDRVLDKDFLEFKGRHEQRSPDGFGGFLNVNLLNEEDFYREYSTKLQTRAQRFLESTGEFNLPLNNSRLYLLAQYWIDLKHETEDVPQRLPEVGYMLNYSKFGPALFSASLTAANMWRDGGLSAGRLDFYPKLLHSFGSDFTVSQTAAFRATAYSFYRDDTVADSSVRRTAFEYDVTGHARLYKRYGDFTHVLEPAIGYHYISSSENDLPVFDVTETYGKTSLIELSLLNRIISRGNEAATVKLTQGIDTYNGDRPLLPLRLEVGLNRWLPLKMDIAYDTYTGKLETVSSDLSLRILKANVSFGQRYNRTENIMVYSTGVSFRPLRNVSVASTILYDATGGGLRDLNMTMRYQRQCWGLRLDMNKTPDDFNVLVLFELAGVNAEPSKDHEDDLSQKALSDLLTGR